MTNKRAISTLNSLKDYYNDKKEDSYVGFDCEDNEALDLAIKVLDQQDTDLDGYSSRLWHNAYERGKADTEAKVLDAIKEIRDLFKQPAAYVPNYDAYGLCLSIVCKHMEEE